MEDFVPPRTGPAGVFLRAPAGLCLHSFSGSGAALTSIGKSARTRCIGDADRGQDGFVARASGAAEGRAAFGRCTHKAADWPGRHLQAPNLNPNRANPYTPKARNRPRANEVVTRIGSRGGLICLAADVVFRVIFAVIDNSRVRDTADNEVTSAAAKQHGANHAARAIIPPITTTDTSTAPQGSAIAHARLPPTPQAVPTTPAAADTVLACSNCCC